MSNVTDIKEASKDKPVDLSIDKLPEALKKEISKARALDYEDELVELVERLGEKLASLNNIQIGYYNEYQKVCKRGTLTNRLAQLVKKGLIDKGDKKGYYKPITKGESDGDMQNT